MRILVFLFFGCLYASTVLVFGPAQSGKKTFIKAVTGLEVVKDTQRYDIPGTPFKIQTFNPDVPLESVYLVLIFESMVGRSQFQPTLNNLINSYPTLEASEVLCVMTKTDANRLVHGKPEVKARLFKWTDGTELPWMPWNKSLGVEEFLGKLELPTNNVLIKILEVEVDDLVSVFEQWSTSTPPISTAYAVSNGQLSVPQQENVEFRFSGMRWMLRNTDSTLWLHYDGERVYARQNSNEQSLQISSDVDLVISGTFRHVLFDGPSVVARNVSCDTISLGGANLTVEAEVIVKRISGDGSNNINVEGMLSVSKMQGIARLINTGKLESGIMQIVSLDNRGEFVTAKADISSELHNTGRSTIKSGKVFSLVNEGNVKCTGNVKFNEIRNSVKGTISAYTIDIDIGPVSNPIFVEPAFNSTDVYVVFGSEDGGKERLPQHLFGQTTTTKTIRDHNRWDDTVLVHTCVVDGVRKVLIDVPAYNSSFYSTSTTIESVSRSILQVLSDYKVTTISKIFLVESLRNDRLSLRIIKEQAVSVLGALGAILQDGSILVCVSGRSLIKTLQHVQTAANEMGLGQIIDISEVSFSDIKSQRVSITKKPYLIETVHKFSATSQIDTTSSIAISEFPSYHLTRHDLISDESSFSLANEGAIRLTTLCCPSLLNKGILVIDRLLECKSCVNEALMKINRSKCRSFLNLGTMIASAMEIEEMIANHGIIKLATLIGTKLINYMWASLYKCVMDVGSILNEGYLRVQEQINAKSVNNKRTLKCHKRALIRELDNLGQAFMEGDSIVDTFFNNGFIRSSKSKF